MLADTWLTLLFGAEEKGKSVQRHQLWASMMIDQRKVTPVLRDKAWVVAAAIVAGLLGLLIAFLSPFESFPL